MRKNASSMNEVLKQKFIQAELSAMLHIHQPSSIYFVSILAFLSKLQDLALVFLLYASYLNIDGESLNTIPLSLSQFFLLSESFDFTKPSGSANLIFSIIQVYSWFLVLATLFILRQIFKHRSVNTRLAWIWVQIMFINAFVLAFPFINFSIRIILDTINQNLELSERETLSPLYASLSSISIIVLIGAVCLMMALNIPVKVSQIPIFKSTRPWIIELLWKSIFYLIFCLWPESSSRNLFLTILTIAVLAFRDYFYFFILPFYNKLLMKQALFCNAVILSGWVCLCLGSNVAKNKYALIIIWLNIGLLVVKLYWNYFEKLLQVIMTQKTKNNHYILQKIAIIKELRNLNLSVTSKQRKIRIESLTSKAYDLNNGNEILDDKIVSKFWPLKIHQIKELLKKRAFFKALTVCQELEKSFKSAASRAALEIIKQQIATKALKEMMLSKSDFIFNYLRSSELLEEIQKLILLQVNHQVDFWSQYSTKDPDFFKLFTLSSKSANLREKNISHLCSLSQRKCLNSSHELLLLLYFSRVNNQPATTESIIRTLLSNQDLRSSNFIIPDENNVIFMVEFSKSKIGTIQNCFLNVNLLFGYEKKELIGSDFTKLFKLEYRSQILQDLQEYFENGSAKLIGKSGYVCCETKSGAIFRGEIEFSISINNKSVANLLVSIRKADPTNEFVLLNERNQVLSVSNQIKELLSGSQEIMKTKGDFMKFQSPTHGKYFSYALYPTLDQTFCWPFQTLKMMRAEKNDGPLPKICSSDYKSLKDFNDMNESEFADDFKTEVECEVQFDANLKKLPSNRQKTQSKYALSETSIPPQIKIVEMKALEESVHKASSLGAKSSNKRILKAVETGIETPYRKKSLLFLFFVMAVILVVSLSILIADGISAVNSIENVENQSTTMQDAYYRWNGLLVAARYVRSWQVSSTGKPSSTSSRNYENIHNNSLLMIQYNTELAEKVGQLSPTLQAEFFDHSVKLVDTIPTPIEAPLLDSFDASQVLIGKFDTILKNLTNEAVINYTDTQYIYENSYNDLLIAYENSVKLTYTSLDQTVSNSQSSILQFSIVGFVMGAFLFIVLVALFFIIKEASNELISMFFNISEEEALDIKQNLIDVKALIENKSKVREEKSKTSLISSEINIAKSKLLTTKARVKSGKKSQNKMPLMASYYKDLAKRIGIGIPLIGLIIGIFAGFYQFFIANLQMITSEQGQIKTSAQMIILANLVASELTELTAAGTGPTFRNQPVGDELMNDVQGLKNMETLAQAYQSTSGNYESRVYSILFNISCADPIFSYQSTYESLCNTVTNGRGYIGAIDAITLEYGYATTYASMVLNQNISLQTVYTLVQNNFVQVARAVNILMGALWTQTSIQFNQFVTSKIGETNGLIVGLVLAYLFLIVVCLPKLYKWIYFRTESLKKFLNLVPMEVILSNRWLKSYLMKTMGIKNWNILNY